MTTPKRYESGRIKGGCSLHDAEKPELCQKHLQRCPEPRLAAILLATPEALQELLQLPAGAYIDSVYSPHDRPGTVELRIRGAGWPCELGQFIPRTTATVTRQIDADGRELARVVDWGLPSSNEPPNAADNRPARQGRSG